MNYTFLIGVIPGRGAFRVEYGRGVNQEGVVATHGAIRPSIVESGSIREEP